jgi:hypothetical protein
MCAGIFGTLKYKMYRIESFFCIEHGLEMRTSTHVHIALTFVEDIFLFSSASDMKLTIEFLLEPRLKTGDSSFSNATATNYFTSETYVC